MKNGKNKAGAKAGRRRKSESRAAEIRARLIAWKQSPEPRISLRVLAAELGTSHQLLSFYLRRLMPFEMFEARSRGLLANLDAEPGLRLGVIQAAIVRQLAKEGVPSAQEVLRKYPEKFGMLGPSKRKKV